MNNPQKVYSVIEHLDYEGSHTLATFSDRADAVKFISRISPSYSEGPSVLYVQEIILDEKLSNLRWHVSTNHPDHEDGIHVTPLFWPRATNESEEEVGSYANHDGSHGWLSIIVVAYDYDEAKAKALAKFKAYLER